jgi:O-succinylbenzoic acid--CoA ligase
MFSINNHQINDKEDLKELSAVENYEKHVLEFLNEWFNDSKTIKTTTSGSTGKPKKIELKKSAMLKSAELTGSYFQLKKNQTALLCLPTRFIAGKMMLVRALFSELNLISIAPSRNPLKNINLEIDFAAMTPMQVNTILTETPDKLNLIRILIIGGAPIEPALENKLKDFKTECYSTFGMTETITHIALRKLNSLTHFEALPTISFEKTEANCLIINAPHVSENKLVTNDKIELISTTSFIWLGRKDNIINSGGIKIQAEELEKKIAPLLPNNRFYVSTVKDEILGEMIILIIEADHTFNSNKLEFKNFNKYSIPKKVYTIEKFKETETGKILRNENKAILGLI